MIDDAPPLRPRRRSAGVNGILVPSPYPFTTIAVAVVAVLVITVVGFVLGTVDLGLAEALNGLHTGIVGAITTAVYHVISPAPAIGITVVVTAVIWWRGRDVRPAAAFIGTIAVTWVPSAIVKELVHRARPDAGVLPHPFSPVQVDPSYPSGHTVYMTAFVVALVWVLRDTRWHRLAVSLGVVAVAVVFFSVTIDAVHFPTDALASIAWSLAVAPAVRVVWVDWLMPRFPFLRDPAGRRVTGF